MLDQTVRRKSLAEVQRVMKEQGVLQGIGTDVDLVLLMDGTASMTNLMKNAKDTALTLYRDICHELGEAARIVDDLRVKVIVYRDVYAGDAVPFQESDFFILRADGTGEEAQYRDFIADIRATGGGDLPENALEALHMAFTTDFAKPGQGRKARHIIAVLSDAGAHPLDDPRRAAMDQTQASRYPQGVPKDLAGLQEEWNALDGASRRLLLFTPNAYPWNSIAGSWESVVHIPSTAGAGIDRAKFQEAISTIAGSIA